MRHYHDVVSDMKLISSVMSKTHSVAGIWKTPERDGSVVGSTTATQYKKQLGVIRMLNIYFQM